MTTAKRNDGVDTPTPGLDASTLEVAAFPTTRFCKGFVCCAAGVRRLPFCFQQEATLSDNVSKHLCPKHMHTQRTGQHRCPPQPNGKRQTLKMRNSWHKAYRCFLGSSKCDHSVATAKGVHGRGPKCIACNMRRDIDINHDRQPLAAPILTQKNIRAHNGLYFAFLQLCQGILIVQSMCNDPASVPELVDQQRHLHANTHRIAVNTKRHLEHQTT